MPFVASRRILRRIRPRTHESTRYRDTRWRHGMDNQRRSSSACCIIHSVRNDHLHSNLQQPRHHINHITSTTQRRRASAFVSKHNGTRTPAEIIDFCKQNELIRNSNDFRQTATHVNLRECPLCTKSTNGRADNMFKMFINSDSGAYYCHRCAASGSWYDFKLKTSPNFAKTVQSSVLNQSRSRKSSSSPLPMPEPRLQSILTSALIDAKTGAEALEYLQKERGLHVKTLRKYGVGFTKQRFPGSNGRWEESSCVTFPWILSVHAIEQQEKARGVTFAWEQPLEDAKSETFITRRLKIRSLENKGWQRLDPAGGGWGLFGYHTLEDGIKSVVLTEGEYDAMAVWQATGMTAVSLPNGCRSLPVEVLPLLEDVDKIYLWMDRDVAGQEGARVFVKKLGIGRTYIVQPTLENCGSAIEWDELPKDANEALVNGLDLKKIIDDAKLVPHERVIHFADLREEVMHEIMYPEKYVGSPITSLPAFTNIIKGFRRGEMTVLTGPTGSGKTTFLGQISLDLVEQGVNVLWGSFEIKNTRLVHKLLQQFSRQPLPSGDPDLKPKLDEIADRFSFLPYHFMKFHGGSDVDDVIDAMEYSVYINDTEHIILDNMQFMVSLKSLSARSTFDKFDVQDVAIEKFRKFATENNVHVTVVVHPRKEQENTNLTLSSVYGSAKATQEADTVLILQNDGNRKFLEVKKNRFNGTLGHSPLHFDRKSCRYSENPVVEVAKKGSQQKTPKGAVAVAKGPAPTAISDPFSFLDFKF